MPEVIGDLYEEITGEKLNDSAEEAEACEQPSREELNMYVVKLHDRDQSEMLRHLGRLIGLCCGEIDSEAEEMLRLWSTAYSFIVAEISEPTCKFKVRIELSHDGESLHQILIERHVEL